MRPPSRRGRLFFSVHLCSYCCLPACPIWDPRLAPAKVSVLAPGKRTEPERSLSSSPLQELLLYKNPYWRNRSMELPNYVSHPELACLAAEFLQMLSLSRISLQRCYGTARMTDFCTQMCGKLIASQLGLFSSLFCNEKSDLCRKVARSLRVRQMIITGEVGFISHVKSHRLFPFLLLSCWETSSTVCISS